MRLFIKFGKLVKTSLKTKIRKKKKNCRHQGWTYLSRHVVGPMGSAVFFLEVFRNLGKVVKTWKNKKKTADTMDEHIISLGMWWAPWGLQFWVFWVFRSPLQFGERSQNFAKPKRFWKFFVFFLGGRLAYIYIYVYVYVYVYMYLYLCIYLCIYVCIIILYIRFILMCSIHVGKLGDFLASHVRLECILNSATLSQKFGAKSHRWTHNLRFAKVFQP